jgi:hypothetical protein
MLDHALADISGVIWVTKITLITPLADIATLIAENSLLLI